MTDCTEQVLRSIHFRSMQMFRHALSLSLSLLFCGWFTSPHGFGSELCHWQVPGRSDPSLLDSVTQADSVMVAIWSPGQPSDPKNGTESGSHLTVLQVIKESKRESENIKVGKVLGESKVDLSRVSDRFLVFGHDRQNQGYRYSTFHTPLPLSNALIEYILQYPGVDALCCVQLAYFAKHLESSDPTVAQEAFDECSKPVEIKDFVEIRDHLAPEKLRQWLTNPKTDSLRIGMYGLLLGIAGNEADIPLLRDISLRPSQEFRIGAFRLFTGYLLLAGVQGLEVLEEAKLKNKTDRFGETYAMMVALRGLWAYGDSEISQDRLRQSMRIVLDRPEWADLAILDLGQWQDWSVSDRLMELYDTAGYDIPSTRRAIVRFFLTAEATKPKDSKEPLPAHVLTAQKHLKTLREKDPETVKAAEKFFFQNF